MTTAPKVTDAMRQAARGKIRHAPECRPTAADRRTKTSSTQPERNIS